MNSADVCLILPEKGGVYENVEGKECVLFSGEYCCNRGPTPVSWV